MGQHLIFFEETMLATFPPQDLRAASTKTDPESECISLAMGAAHLNDGLWADSSFVGKRTQFCLSDFIEQTGIECSFEDFAEKFDYLFLCISWKHYGHLVHFKSETRDGFDFTLKHYATKGLSSADVSDTDGNLKDLVQGVMDSGYYEVMRERTSETVEQVSWKLKEEYL